jgi:hypothetical protein
MVSSFPENLLRVTDLLLARGGQEVEVLSVQGQTHVLLAKERVTDGARTRDLL